jgi:hypothetical protein
MSNNDGYQVAYEYTVRYFPRYFTWVQFHINSDNSNRSGAGDQIANRLTGPLGMGPEYKVVVAINDDTIYAEAFVDVSDGPVPRPFRGIDPRARNSHRQQLRQVLLTQLG